MKTIAIEVPLGLAVFSAWLGCVSFARLRSSFDRIHCVTFVNAASGLALVIAAFVADGLSDRALKILFLAFVSLINGAALSHATGRALFLRQQQTEHE